jgi:hypothetical protein
MIFLALTSDWRPVAIRGTPRLRHFEQGITYPVMIADAHFGIRQSLDCKILSELVIGKVVSAELVLPITIRFDLVDKDRPVFAAVPGQISLPVSIDVEPSCHPSASNRRFPDGGVDGSPLPLDVAWPAHIYREQTRHRCLIERQIESAKLRPASFILTKGWDSLEKPADVPGTVGMMTRNRQRRMLVGPAASRGGP